jgi:hypothetical protein
MKMSEILSEVSDYENQEYMFQTTHTKLLAKIVNKKIDPVMLAKQELAARGLDLRGKWIGHDAAEEYYGLKKSNGKKVSKPKTYTSKKLGKVTIPKN